MAKRKKFDIVTDIEVNETVVLETEETPIITPKTPIYKTQTCKVIWVKQNKFAISFSGYGVELSKSETETIGDSVTVKYEGEIGKPKFKIYR